MTSHGGAGGSGGSKVSSTTMMLKDVEWALSILDNQKQSPSNQEFQEAQENLRRHVCEQTNLRLTDLDKVGAELAKDLSTPGQSQVILDFLLFLMGQNPVTFTGEQDNPHDHQICKGLNKWLLSRLLVLLSDHHCRRVHSKVIEVILKLLDLLMRRSLHLYQEILFNVFNILEKICNISYDSFQNGAIECLEDPISLQLISCSLDNKESLKGKTIDFSAIFADNEPIKVYHFSSCYYLQINLSKILSELVNYGGVFGAKHSGYLWALLCIQLEQSHIPIKQVSLHAATLLLEQGNMPPLELVDYFTDLIAGILSIIMEQTENTELTEVQAPLEQSLGKCLELMFSMRTAGTFDLPDSFLDLMFEFIGETLPNHGFNSIKTDELLQSIARTVLYMTVHVPAAYNSSIKRTAMDHFSSYLIESVGPTTKCQGFLPSLVSMISQELPDHLDSPPVASCLPALLSESSDVSGDERSNELQKKSRLSRTRIQKPTKSDCHTSTEHHQMWEKASSTLQKLKNRLHQLCSEKLLSANDALGTTRGINICLRVIYHVSNDTQKDSQYILSLYSTDEMQQITAFLVRALGASKTLNGQRFNTLFSLVVDCAGLLMLTSEGIHHYPLISQECSWILSIPWLPFHSKWLDLKVQGDRSLKDVADLSNSLEAKIDDQSKTVCLQHLAFLPKEIAPKWRLLVLRTALSGNTEEISRAALSVFPFFLFHLGASYNHLLQELVVPHISGCSDSIAECLAKMIGPVMCVINRQCAVKRSSIQEEDKLPQIVCSVCCDGSSPADYIEARVVAPFLSLLSRNTATKLAFIKNLPLILQHLDLEHTNTAVTKIIMSCMQLSTDKTLAVREQFRVNLKYLVRSGRPCSSHNIQAVVTILKKAFDAGKADPRLEENVVLMLGELGKVGDGDLLLVVVISLLDSLLSSSTLVKATAFHQLKDVADAKSYSLPDLFTKFKGQICKFVVDSMEEAVQRKKEDITWIADTIAHAFGFIDTKTFLSKHLNLFLPLMVKKASDVTTVMLKVLGTQLQKKHREMLVINFKYVFSYLVRNCTKEELEKALFYVHRETEFDFSSLLHIDYQSFHNELLLHLSENYSKVFGGLAMLAAKDDSYKGPKPITLQEDMADFLQPRLLGILAFFDSQLLNSHIPLEDKKLALESLVFIMRLMGQKHITGVRVKIMTTLKIGLQYKEHGFPVLSCRAWDCYVRSVEPSALGPMLSHIMVTLLPLLHDLPSQVAAIFNFLVVENQETLSEHFSELYFMPTIPELQEVNKVLEQYKAHSKSKPDVRTQLREAMKGVGHDSVDVRVHALSKLRDLLYANQSSVHAFVMGSEDVDSIITELLSVLLSGCRDSSAEAQNLFGECLGALGAVDPGRLDLATSNKKQHRIKVFTNVDDINFAYDLISELARGFLAASDTRAQDCSAYALQEMLQIYECSDTTSSQSTGQQLWQKMPQHIQEILTPLLHTKYVPSNPTAASANVPQPIYRSPKGNTYKEWVCYWTGHLVNKVKQKKASRVFKACRVIIKHDINTALFLLPYILQHVLIDSDRGSKGEIQHEILAVLRHAEQTDDVEGSEDSHLSAQTVFSVLDHLTKWKQQRALELMSFAKSQSKAALAKAAGIEQDPGIQAVTEFLKQIPQDVLSRASYQCKAYARALMHYEAHLKHDQDLQGHLPYLQKIYVALDEPDGVLGVSATRKGKATLHDQILDHESTGKLGEAQACYEQAIQLEPHHLGNHQGLLKSLMDLGQMNTALSLVNGVLAEKPELTPQLNAYRVEACWKLSRWDSLETHLKKETSSADWRVGIGNILMAAKNKDLNEFSNQLKVVRTAQMGPLSAASMEKGSYQRGYEFITRLHMLSDIERGLKNLVFSAEGDQHSEDDGLFSEWSNRFALTQASFRVQEPLLCIQRIILGLSDRSNDPIVKQEIGQHWLASAKVARKANQMQAAYSFLLNASQYSLPEVCLEKAKWLWNKGDGHQALICLQKGVAEHFSARQSQQNPKQRAAHAKALLLIGRCIEDTAKVDSNTVMRRYKEVVDINPEWEEGHFYMAKYYDRLMFNLTDRPERAGEFVYHIIQGFGQSLRYGNQHIYQSMPHLLTRWLDYGAHVADIEKGKTKGGKTAEATKARLIQLNTIMDDLTKKLAPYQFLTSFSQLISRICHAHPAVFQHLQEIIAKVIVNFPQQAVWMSMAVSKSTHQMRQTRCREIFCRAVQLQKSLQKFIQDATKLTDRLLELCNKNVDRDCNMLSINKDFRNLKRLVTDRNFSNIIVPLQSLMTVTLPSSQTPHKQHDPFPTTPVYICGFDDGVEVLASLQQPKKIGIQGNNGKVYVMLCKPKDDLRKDNRLMEVNGIINKCLMKDADARWRQLHIRTYAVIPLNEECGIIEWVPNTSGLRHILNRLYRQRGIFISGQELKALFPPQSANIEVKMKVFREKLLPKFPPVFSEWFLKTFPDPTSWYLSRLSYARTAAVMSMVGYILGLGDRHGENILMDSTRGDCVHVDFNCLFNKGETFDWPEVVPFRLTHNMLNGMGPLGVEGVFRRACEVTMGVMRDQKDPLMSILRTLVYDPLVEWSKPSRSRSTTQLAADTGEINNEKAQVHVRDIELRLQGKLKSKHRGLPLSIEGHVDHLIREATDVKNLCQMYVGWAAYL